MSGDLSVADLPVGTIVRILHNIGGAMPVGAICTVTDPPNGNLVWNLRGHDVCVKSDSLNEGGRWGGGYFTARSTHVQIVTPAPSTPSTKESTDMPTTDATLEQQLAAARVELAEFKLLVRRRLREEARAREWCSEANGWLRSLGLEPLREAPKEIGTVVRLDAEDGVIASLIDHDDTPWKTTAGNWYGADEVAERIHEVLIKGSYDRDDWQHLDD